MPTLKSSTLSVTIDRAWTDVYDYASDPANMSHWAAGLGSGFERSGDDWMLFDPVGNPIRMRFTERNGFGVLDHDVFVDGQMVHIAMRVVPNGDGAEVTFLLLQGPGQSDAAFLRDAGAVMKDLETLKTLMER